MGRSWCNVYHPRKWIQLTEFKFCTKLFAYHIALIAIGTVCIQLFSL